jgi:HAD superfamily hydrolase (TIGR01490 family)
MTIVTTLRSAAFFDLDLTITSRDSFRLFLKVFYLKKVPRMVYVPYVLFYWGLRRLRLISLKQFKEKALIGLKGKSREDIDRIGSEFFKTHLKHILREKAVDRIENHKRNGDLVFIVTASPDIYVGSVTESLGCDGYACTRLAHPDNRFDGSILGADCIGAEKQREIRHIAEEYSIDLDRSCAYSDHEADMMFLESAGTKVAVSPTETLYKTAVSKGWRIESW